MPSLMVATLIQNLEKIHSGSRKLYPKYFRTISFYNWSILRYGPDKRWERIKLAYDLLVNGQGTHSRNAVATMEESYANNVTDEFIDPITIIDSNDKANGQSKKVMLLFL
jgi:bisphosphoglycerate-independent phosphoglycerate mutase (AlkP superfamily)